MVHHWMMPPKIHTTADIAQKLAITQYCEQDQPTSQNKEMTFSMNPSWLVQGNTDEYLQRYFQVRKGEVFSYQINDTIPL